MKLLPSLKQKKRYVAFEIISDRAFSAQEVEGAVMAAIREFIGQLGMAKSSPEFIKEQYSGSRFVLKMNHRFVKEIISSLLLITEISSAKATIKSVVTSGILKKVSE